MNINEKNIITIYIKKLDKDFIENFDLNENENFEIENIYKIPNEIIEICLYDFEKNKYNLAKELEIENIIKFMIHYKMEKEIEVLIEICLRNEREIEFNEKIEKLVQYKLKSLATKDPKLACENNFFVCLKINYEKENRFDNEKLVEVTALKGYLECMKFLIEKKCPFNLNSANNAVVSGHLDCLKYLHKNGCALNNCASVTSALNGHLECLIYLHENGCPFSELAISYAALNGHFDCLKYLHKKGCPWDSSAIIYSAKKRPFRFFEISE